VFRAANGSPFAAQESHRLVFGAMVDKTGAVLDRGLAVRFPGGHSYTGEDAAELHCHGSPVALRELLTTLFAWGARQARPGEFTQRAFLNGRMDLTEAEAVIDLIDAQTAAAARNAIAQLSGALRRPLEAVQTALTDVASRFYAVVDYPDEDIADVRPDQIDDALRTADSALSALLATCARGRVLKNGVRTAIVGRPNAGKSSLLNALAGYDRAIVADAPGTTRDTVEETVVCGGVALRLIDTAGIRDTDDPVEKLGVERARQAMASADLVLAVADGSVPLTQEDLALACAAARGSAPWLLILSKRDLSRGPAAFFCTGPDATPPAAQLSLSSVTGEGLAELEAAVAALFPAGHADGGALLTDARQEDAVLRAREAVDRARTALDGGLTPDAVVTDIEEALNAVGELTGRTAREDIVERIFSRFCVGK
jgi:tRNA modification GTPase